MENVASLFKEQFAESSINIITTSCTNGRKVEGQFEVYFSKTNKESEIDHEGSYKWL